MDINDIKKRLPQRYPLLLVDRVVEMDLGKRILPIKTLQPMKRFLMDIFQIHQSFLV